MKLFDTEVLLLTILCAFCQQTQGTFYSSACAYVTSVIKIQCSEKQHIKIINATLARSTASCLNKKTCCPKDTVCRVNASAQHVHNLMNSCDGKQKCQVTGVYSSCYYYYYYYYNYLKGDTDYEQVKYSCINNPPTTIAVITTTTTMPTVTKTPSATTPITTTTAPLSLSATATLTTTDQVSRPPETGIIGGSRSTGRKTNTDTSSTNIALIAGLVAAACVVVIAAVLVIVIICRTRVRSAARRPAQDSHQSTQSDIYGITEPSQITSFGQSRTETSTNVTVPDGLTVTPSDDTHVYYNNDAHTVALPGGERVYYNSQCGVSVASQKSENIHTSPNNQSEAVNESEDYDYVWKSGGSEETGGAEEGGKSVGKHNLEYVDIDQGLTPEQMSEEVSPRSPGVTYAEVQCKNDNGETSGDDNMQMVENEMYN